MRVPTRRAAKMVALALPVMLAISGTPAGAADAGAAVFRGVATAPGLCYPGIGALNDLGAPVADCGATGLPGAPDSTGWTLTSPLPGNTGDFCIGAAATAGVGISTDSGDVVGSCLVTGGGSVVAFADLLGAWCGLSHGFGTGTVAVTGQVGSASTTSGVEWIVSAGTVLPITDTDVLDGNVVAGVVDAVGALGGGNCATAESVAFNVVGVLVAVEAP